jgi:glutamate synthase (NADPH/NADH) small chain
MIYRVSAAHEEGGERVYAVSTAEFRAGPTGAVGSLRLADVELHDGRFEPVHGTERVIPAELVLLAMGFSGPEQDGVVGQLGVELDARGNVARDVAYMTSQPGVFVAGDAGRGQSLIVWAIAEGRSAAAAVDAHLTGSTTLPSPIPPTARPLAV